MTDFTKLELEMIEKIVKSCYRNSLLEHNDPVWVFDCVETNADKGVISSLIKKNIVEVYEWDDENVVEFTKNGLTEAMFLFPDE